MKEAFAFEKTVGLCISPQEFGRSFAGGTSGQQSAFLNEVASIWETWQEFSVGKQMEFLCSGLSPEACQMLMRLNEYVQQKMDARLAAGIE